MKIPDWIVLFGLLGLVLWALFTGARDRADAPEPLPPELLEDISGTFPSITGFEEDVLVQVGHSTNSIGTAFAIDKHGHWMTARHVVDGCDDIGILYGGGRVLDVEKVVTSDDSDIAILKTPNASKNLHVDLEKELEMNQAGFHIGFPQGQPGEVSSRLLARSRLITRGRYKNEEPVLAWAEMGRTRNLKGSLAGISGGPVFNLDGEVIGVTVAESPRRGRIYTAAPTSVARVLNENKIAAAGDNGFRFGIEEYGHQADLMRRELSVVKILCQAE